LRPDRRPLLDLDNSPMLLSAASAGRLQTTNGDEISGMKDPVPSKF